MHDYAQDPENYTSRTRGILDSLDVKFSELSGQLGPADGESGRTGVTRHVYPVVVLGTVAANETLPQRTGFTPSPDNPDC